MEDDNEKLLEGEDLIDNEYFEEALSKYSELIGIFIMRFSVLEHELNIAIAEIISGSHEIGYAIMERMSMRNKIDLFYNLYNLEVNATGWANDELPKIKTALVKINDFRNYIAHANWQTIKKNGTVRTKFTSDTSTGWIKFKNLVIRPEDIRVRVKETKELTEKIYDYQEKFFDSLY